MPETLRQDQSSVTITVDGREMRFVANKLDGGELSAEGSKTFPGGGRTQRAHGGPQTVENVTATLEIVPDRDDEDIRFCEERVGKSDASLVENRLDVNGNVAGRFQSWSGIIIRVSKGNYDANSSDPRECEVEIETHGVKG
jgi:hypothetical protein